jgi:hypothetical protein
MSTQPAEIRRGIIRAYSSTTRLVSVQLASAPEETIDFRAADDLLDDQIVVGRECAVIAYTPDDPADAIVSMIHSPSGIAPFYRLFLGDMSDPTTAPGSGIVIYSRNEGLVSMPHVMTNLGSPGGYFPMVGGAFGELLTRSQFGTIEPYEGGHLPTRLWGAAPVEVGTPTDNLFDSTHGLYVRWTTGIVAGDDAGIRINGAGNGPHARNLLPWLLVKLRLPTTSSIRMFAGLTDQTLGTMIGSDTPAGSFIGLSHSTPRGDANWMFIKNDGAGGQTNNNTSVAISTNPIYFRIAYLSLTQCLMTLHDANFAVTFGTISDVTNQPGSTTRLGFVAGVETQVNAARDFDLFYARGFNRI